MAIEIERKFLLTSDTWRGQVSSSERLSQAYLASSSAVTVRVRIASSATTPDAGNTDEAADSAQDNAWLTLKGAPIATSDPDKAGSAQHEFEYEIPVKDATSIMQRLADSAVIDKTRHSIMHEGHLWVVDEFHGDNQGLVVAEIELDDMQQQFTIPDWAGADVTQDFRYRNKFLAHNPYNQWPENDPDMLV